MKNFTRQDKSLFCAIFIFGFSNLFERSFRFSIFKLYEVLLPSRLIVNFKFFERAFTTETPTHVNLLKLCMNHDQIFLQHATVSLSFCRFFHLYEDLLNSLPSSLTVTKPSEFMLTFIFLQYPASAIYRVIYNFINHVMKTSSIIRISNVHACLSYSQVPLIL